MPMRVRRARLRAAGWQGELVVRTGDRLSVELVLHDIAQLVAGVIGMGTPHAVIVPDELGRDSRSAVIAYAVEIVAARLQRTAARRQLSVMDRSIAAGHSEFFVAFHDRAKIGRAHV